MTYASARILQVISEILTSLYLLSMGRCELIMFKTFGNPKARLDCVHVVPGDGRNKLVEEIIDSNLIKYGVVSIYDNDQNMKRRCQELGVSFHCLRFEEKRLFSQFLALLFYVLRTKPRILILHSFYPSLLGVGLVILCPFTKIVSVRHHNMVHLLSKNRKGIVLDKLISRILFRTIAVSNAVKETMINQGGKSKKILVIYNGIRRPDSNHVKSTKTPNFSKIRLLAAGRLDWQKNYETMLQVAVTLKNRGVDFNLSILGTGSKSYSASLFEKAKLLGLADCVQWEGWQPDIEKWYSESDIFLHTAVDEACPLVLIEALLAGLPVVTSDAGGSGEIASGFALCCRATDIAAYADNITLTWKNLNVISLKSQIQVPVVEAKFGITQMRKAYEEFSLSILD